MNTYRNPTSITTLDKYYIFLVLKFVTCSTLQSHFIDVKCELIVTPL